MSNDEHLAEVIAFPTRGGASPRVGWGGRPIEPVAEQEPAVASDHPAATRGVDGPAASSAGSGASAEVAPVRPATSLGALREQIRRIESRGDGDAAADAAGRADDLDAAAAGVDSGDGTGARPEPGPDLRRDGGGDGADSAAGAAAVHRTGHRSARERATPGWGSPRASERGTGRRPRVAFVETESLDDTHRGAGQERGGANAEGGSASRARRGAAAERGASRRRPERGTGTRAATPPPRTAIVTALPGTVGDLGAIEEASDALVRWLGRAPRSVRDARHFLRDGFEELGEVDIERIIDRMLELGYLDDLALAEQLRDGRFRRRNLGRTAMARELRELGIDETDIETALGEFDRDAEYEQALELARSRARRVSVGDRDTAYRRLHAYLARRGYSGELASRAVRAALDEC